MFGHQSLRVQERQRCARRGPAPALSRSLLHALSSHGHRAGKAAVPTLNAWYLHVATTLDLELLQGMSTQLITTECACVKLNEDMVQWQ